MHNLYVAGRVATVRAATDQCDRSTVNTTIVIWPTSAVTLRCNSLGP
jgi:hypothetical protein